MIFQNPKQLRFLSIKAALCCFFLYSFAIKAQSVVTSPDGKLQVKIAENNGKPTYSVSYNGKFFLESSTLGLKTNVGDFSSGLVLGNKVILIFSVYS